MYIPTLQRFFDAYVECALWSSTDESDDRGGEPMDRNYTESDITPETLWRMAMDCQSFVDACCEYIEASDDGNWPVQYNDGLYSQAGHDFWLTRNGHGCGFWDGDWPDHGELLTLASQAFGEFDLYVNDDGQIDGCGSKGRVCCVF